MIGQTRGLFLAGNDVHCAAMMDKTHRYTVLDLHGPEMSELISVEWADLGELRAGLE